MTSQILSYVIAAPSRCSASASAAREPNVDGLAFFLLPFAIASRICLRVPAEEGESGWRGRRENDRGWRLALFQDPQNQLS
jgi:hypothetical protein